MKRILKRTWKQIRGYIPLSIFTFIMIMFSAPVLAAYNYVIPIQVANNSSTSYTNLPLLVTLDNDQLVTEGFIDVTGLDTDVQESSPIPFSVVDDKLGIYLDNLAASQTLNLSDYLGFTPNATDYPIIPGVGGYAMTVDDASIELGNNSTVEIEGYINTDADYDKYIVYKENSFVIEVDNTVDGTITAGITASEAFAPGVPYEYDTNASTMFVSAKLEDNKYVVAYKDNFSDGIALVAEASGITVTSGALYEFYNNIDGTFFGIGLVALDSNRVFIAYSNATDHKGYGVVGTISGTVISYGTPVVFDATGDAEYLSACLIADDKVAIVYNDEAAPDVGTVVICTVVDTVVTAGTPVAFEGNIIRTSCCPLDEDKFFTLYRDNADSDIKACAFTVVGTVPTPGVIKVIQVGTGTGTACCQLDTDKVAIAFVDSGSSADTEVCTVVGTIITEGAAQTYDTSGSLMPTVGTMDNTHYFLAYEEDTSNDLYVRRNIVSGTTVTLGTEAIVDVSYGSHLGSCSISSNKIALAYDNAGNAGQTTACVWDITYDKSVSALLVDNDEMKITVTLDTVDLKIYIDDVEEGTIALAGSTATDNGNSWFWISGSDTMPYMNFATIDVAGVNKLWYQPVTIIQGTAAVDRSGTGNHGVISWGANPAGIEITASAVISATDYFATTDGATIPSPLPIPSGFNQTATNTTGIADFWLYGLVNRAALSLGFSAQTMYVIIGLIAATGVGFGALIGTGNMLGFAIGFGATAGLFAATGVMPWWVVTITIAIVGMGIYTWRRG